MRFRWHQKGMHLPLIKRENKKQGLITPCIFQIFQAYIKYAFQLFPRIGSICYRTKVKKKSTLAKFQFRSEKILLFFLLQQIHISHHFFLKFSSRIVMLNVGNGVCCSELLKKRSNSNAVHSQEKILQVKQDKLKCLHVNRSLALFTQKHLKFMHCICNTF